MATGRTISASFLTDFDKKVIELCEKISDRIFNSITDKDKQKLFKKEYGKISLTRDGGLRLGAGKLQRDTVCTRGRQGKAPYSNRNLRWHPLIVAENQVNYAKEIERVEIDGEDESQVLVFVIKNSKGQEEKYPSDKVHELPERYVALPKHWMPHIDKLKNWSDTLWTNNSCIIPAYECCDWWQAVETYAVLGISIGVELFKIDFDILYNKIVKILKQQTISDIILPSSSFPVEKDEFILCPVCKSKFTNGLSKFFSEEPEKKWYPEWRTSKIDEIIDNNLQIIHVTPLTENEIKHTAENTRYGHRWCNITKSNHSVEQTINIFGEILKSHGKNLPAIQANDNEIVFLRYEIDKPFQSISVAIKQYFDYFSEYVKRVKGKEIFFYVKPLQTGFEFRVNSSDLNVVEEYLTEYANLVNEKIEGLIINFDNETLPEDLKKSSYISIKQQIVHLQQSVEILSFEKNVIEKHNKILETIITDLTETIKEKSKQPIQIFNQSLPIGEIKQLVLEIFAELRNTNTALPTEEERILDMYSHLDRFPIQNKPDYQKRVNQWLSDNSELNPLSQEYLLSAEFLFDVLFKADTNDYSPFVLQFCRVVENELLKQLFVAFYKHITHSKSETEIKTDYAWDFVKANKNKDFAAIFVQPTEPELMLAKMLEYLKRLNDTSFISSTLLCEFKTFINQTFDVSVILNPDFINKIDFVRENYRNKAAHPDRNTIKLNLSEAQKCQSLVREILVLWLESKK